VNTSFSKVLLWEVSNTGAKTKEIFENSIGNLHETVLSSILSDVEFQAALAIDIMDRNLYERANDCRWWALTSAFKEILSSKEPTSADFEKMSQILSYINSLYTVYTSLFVFDKNCKVVAVSQDSDRHMVSKTLSEEHIKQTLNIKDSQKYTVSPFVKSHIYGGEETYIYLASLLSSSKNGETVGGIGIVFDSKPQFEAMLSDALPLDEKGEPIKGSFGVYADRSKKIVSCTDKQICEKSFHALSNEYFEIRNGFGASGIVNFGGAYYAVGARVSDGYREFKSESDSYKNDIVALIFVPLGEAYEKEVKKEKPSKHLRVEVSHRFESENSTEIASFYIGDKWLGIRSELVVEAVNAKGLTLIPGANRMLSGRINYNNKTVDVLNLSYELGAEPKEIGEDTQIVITKIDKDIEESDEPIKYFGILVDELGEIPEVPNSRIDSLNTVFGTNELLGDGIVKPENSGNETQMLVIINPRKLLDKLLKKS
jgi:chemotaxis signal transduction protein